MRPARSALIALVAALVAGGAHGAHAAGDPQWTTPKARRGEVAPFYAVRGKDWVYVVGEFIFDGDRWIPLASEPGWRLYIDLQHEQDPEAME